MALSCAASEDSPLATRLAAVICCYVVVLGGDGKAELSEILDSVTRASTVMRKIGTRIRMSYKLEYVCTRTHYLWSVPKFVFSLVRRSIKQAYLLYASRLQINK